MNKNLLQQSFIANHGFWICNPETVSVSSLFISKLYFLISQSVEIKKAKRDFLSLGESRKYYAGNSKK